ncbi:MAG: succinylglutamate desuccinylase/aspartoacylase family protein [Planctomycetes bacterium]|nr:succinylglutamate desuccinylase/aspartoacylase family protein [Planctomycetota bacterium]
MTGAAVAALEVRRELGVYDCGQPGPTLLVLAGIHGNEPAGVHAVRAVLRRLQELELPLRGRLVALAGNLPALASGKRFLARDLNRGWSEPALAALAARDPEAPGADPEDREQRQLLHRFEQVLRTASGPVAFVDLHTSSADGPPFLCLADTIDNRRLGLSTGVPILLGIEETIDGASLEWFAKCGVLAMAVEGGRHEHPATVGNHEAVLWLVLEHLRMLPSGSVDSEAQRRHLAAAVGATPPIVEIVRRHAITEADAFRMRPGFTNFAPVVKGAVLAEDRNGPIRAPHDCLVMLPLYQRLGDDGFFLARPVRRFWLHVASGLRRLGLPALVSWLPGVRRDPDDPLTILVDPRVARWFVTEVFHLLGFRKERRRGALLAFSRRWSRPENARLGRGGW